jgi:hypothetical protein
VLVVLQGGSSGTFDFSEALFQPTGTVEFLSGTTTIANTMPSERSIPTMAGTVVFNADQTLDSVRYNTPTIRAAETSFSRETR